MKRGESGKGKASVKLVKTKRFLGTRIMALEAEGIWTVRKGGQEET